MTDSQSPEEGIRRVLLEFRVTGPHSWSVASFPPNNGHPFPTFISQIGNTSRTINIKPNKRPGLEKKPYPSSPPKQIFASATQQMAHVRKRSSEKQNLSTNHEGKHKSVNGKKSEQAEQVRLETIIGMIGENTNKKRPREQSVQWLDNEISFPSTPGCQLVNSPIILVALIKGFLLKQGQSLKNPECLVGFSSEKFRGCGLYYPLNDKISHRNGIATMTTERETLHECRRMEEAQGQTLEGRVTFLRIQAPDPEGTTSTGREENEKDEGRNEPLEKSFESKPPKKVIIHNDYPDQTITIGGNLSAECRFGLIEMLRKYADAFAWTPTDMTGIPRFIAEHELKTYPHIEPRVQRKRSIAPDRRKVVKDEVAEWLKAGIVRKVRYLTWVANPVLVKKPDSNWRMCIDFKDLNKACPKDLYPLPKID
ncbi:hypothetical protein Tco_1449944 [Tanacetum coccineum]